MSNITVEDIQAKIEEAFDIADEQHREILRLHLDSVFMLGMIAQLEKS